MGADTLIKPPRRLLVIPPRFIGDVIVMTGLLKAIKATYPECQCHVMLPPSLHPLLARCEFVDELLAEPPSLVEYNRFVRQRQYDTAILLRRSLTDALKLRLAGVRRLIGFREQRLFSPSQFLKRGLFLDEAVIYPPLKSPEPHLKLLAVVLRPLGIVPEALSDACLKPEIALDSDDNAMGRLFAEKHVGPAPKMAVIQTQTASKEKVLQPEQFVPALRVLHEAGFVLVALGAAEEEAAVSSLAALAGVPIINYCGQTTLRQSAAILSHAALYFGLDSGPAHLAAAMGVPSLAVIYGPINEQQWRPWPYSGHFTAIVNDNITCRPCLPKHCAHNACRTGLTPEAIATALRLHLNAGLSAVESHSNARS